MADDTHWPGTWLNPIADHSKGDHAGILQVMSKFPESDPVMVNGLINDEENSYLKVSTDGNSQLNNIEHKLETLT
ncbi:hypothetical protein GOBAR_DD14956 [Gossypium barbadense]|nr:hypothetical protein GOBAR_DD14956 [Gossypium barbadense]